MSIKKDNQFIDNEKELVEIFNSHEINFVNMTGILPGPLNDLVPLILVPIMICKKITFIV